MKLLVLSHKLCWRLADGGFATRGGFALQMRALSDLFSSTEVWVPVAAPGPLPDGLMRLDGRQLEVVPLSPLSGAGWRRRLGWLVWLLRHGPAIWRALGRADAVHTPVPSDVGTLGLMLALLRRKRLLVRHCGTWGARRSLADRLLLVLLPRLAGGRVVVLATGGGQAPPSPHHPAVEWIFSTSLSAADLERPAAPRWRPGEAPRLISVGRLEAGKNVAAAIDALAIVRRQHPAAKLQVVGDGPERSRLEGRAAELGLGNAVEFRGNLTHDQVLDELGDAHLLVFPTRVAEGFPKAVVEALALGVPVIAPPVSVIPELIRGCGRVIEETSGEALARAVLEILAAPDELAAMAMAARPRARAYTLDRWARRIAEILRRSWRVEALDRPPEAR